MRIAGAVWALAIAGCAAVAPAASGREVATARLDYLELPATDIEAARNFYERAFGWSLTDFAPTYSATTTGDTDVGLDADKSSRPKVPLPVIQVPNLEAALVAVERSGGSIVRPIFSFPSGRRFHFRDPSGNELAAWEPDRE